MSLFYLVRHGETDWNREQVFRGRVDVPLNDLGRQQAQAAARKLSEADLTAVYTSPLKRAGGTADIVARLCGLQAVVENGFIDMNFGEWQGLTHGDVQSQFPEAYRRWQRSPESASIPGAESLRAVQERAVAALKVLAERFPDAAVCVVSHRVGCKLLMAWALGLDESAFWRIRQDTVCINVIEYVGRSPVVHTLNDTCHLTHLSQQRRDSDF